MILLLIPFVVATLLIYDFNAADAGTSVVEIHISYSGQWDGFYDSGNSVQRINGTSPTVIQLQRPQNVGAWTIIVSVQKKDTSPSTLNLALVAGVRLLDTDFTNGPFASALVSYTAGPLWCSRPIPFYC
jgi:hypothetical protein